MFFSCCYANYNLKGGFTYPFYITNHRHFFSFSFAASLAFPCFAQVFARLNAQMGESSQSNLPSRCKERGAPRRHSFLISNHQIRFATEWYKYIWGGCFFVISISKKSIGKGELDHLRARTNHQKAPTVWARFVGKETWKGSQLCEHFQWDARVNLKP